MKKFLAVALCSGALVGAPAVYAQAAAGAGGHGGGDGVGTTSPHAPVTPSQTETSQGAVVTPPPLDRSGNPEHVSEKRPNTGNGTGQSGAAGDSGTAPGTGGQDGTGTGTGSGTGTGDGASGDGSGSGGSSGGGN